MTQPDIYTVEARRRLAAATSDPGLAANILKGRAVCHYSDALAATLRELNWQPPVDPDLVEARKIVVDQRRNLHLSDGPHAQILSGGWDNEYVVGSALAAIKRGRELAAQERGQ